MCTAISTSDRQLCLLLPPPRPRDRLPTLGTHPHRARSSGSGSCPGASSPRTRRVPRTRIVGGITHGAFVPRLFLSFRSSPKSLSFSLLYLHCTLRVIFFSFQLFTELTALHRFANPSISYFCSHSAGVWCPARSAESFSRKAKGERRKGELCFQAKE